MACKNNNIMIEDQSQTNKTTRLTKKKKTQIQPIETHRINTFCLRFPPPSVQIKQKVKKKNEPFPKNPTIKNSR